MSTWYYMKNGAQTGPISTDELKALIASGAVKADTLVWREGLAAWAAANTQSAFAGIAPATPPPPPPSATGSNEKPAEFTPEAADVEQNKVMGVLSYIFILWLVPLLAARQSKFSMFHCNQGLVLFLTCMVVWLPLVVISFIPFVNLIMLIVWPVYGISALVLVILGIINAATGKCKPLPVIGALFTLVK